MIRVILEWLEWFPYEKQYSKTNLIISLIDPLQNAFWITKCEKYFYCPHKNATLNEASISYHMGSLCVNSLYSSNWKEGVVHFGSFWGLSAVSH